MAVDRSMPVDVVNDQSVREHFAALSCEDESVLVLQKEVNHRLMQRLAWLRIQPCVILDGGAGYGYGSRQLQQAFLQACVISIDLTDTMLALLNQRRQYQQPWYRRWRRQPSRALCASLYQLPIASGTADVFWCCLAIQWLSALPDVLQEIRRVLRPGGVFIFATLGPDTLQEVRGCFPMVDASHHARYFLDMHDIGDALMQCGFADPVLDVDEIVLSYRSKQCMVQDIRRMGSIYSLIGNDFEAVYTLPAETTSVTYEIIYGHGWRVADHRKNVMSFHPRLVTAKK